MKPRFSTGMAVICIGLLAGSSSQAQSWQLLTQSIALKSGESVEVADIYWVMNCRSQLTSPPEVTVLDGPPGVIATITEAMVVPRFQQCSKPVKGGKLKLIAGKIEDESRSEMTIRIRYKTKDGVRDQSKTFIVALFP